MIFYFQQLSLILDLNILTVDIYGLKFLIVRCKKIDNRYLKKYKSKTVYFEPLGCIKQIHFYNLVQIGNSFILIFEIH